MKEEEIKTTLSKNLSKYRKEAGLTQTELAEKINYSDKSVSKWERGDGVPEITVLTKIAEVCNTSVGTLLGEDVPQKEEKVKKEKKKKPPITNASKIMITALSVLGVWLILSITYFVLHTVGVTAFIPQLIFICALPASFLLLTIFSCIWATPLLSFLASTGLVATLMLVFECFIGTSVVKAMIPFTLILEAILAIMFFMIHRLKESKKNKKEADCAEDK